MDLFYKIALNLHSWNRYAILIGGIAVIYFTIKGLSTKTALNKPVNTSFYIFLSSLHFQLFVGLIMYFFLSPFTLQAFSDFGAAMKDGILRFWAVEHALINFIAIVVAQTGSILAKRQAQDLKKHRVLLIWTSIAMVLIIMMIPMGIMGVDRPWFRF